MKVLITGSRGQLGIELIKQLSGKEQYILIETDVHNLDITDQKQVFELIEEQKPDVIINCAAYTNVDGCEANEIDASKVNAIGAQNLSSGAYSIGAKMVQVSTDYVFDGTGNVPKREYDKTNPQSVYGTSKELGEQLVRQTNPKHFILRTAWLYGEGNNFVRTMLKLSKEKSEINVVNDQIGSPTSTVDLGRCIIDLIGTDSYGTYHGTCEGQCSWYDFAKSIFEFKGINIKVNPMTSDQLDRPAPRPKFSVLDNFMLKLVGLNSFRQWEEALKEYLKDNY
jgi:dTDP-4-dehydrorhamnose reductase